MPLTPAHIPITELTESYLKLHGIRAIAKTKNARRGRDKTGGIRHMAFKKSILKNPKSEGSYKSRGLPTLRDTSKLLREIKGVA